MRRRQIEPRDRQGRRRKNCRVFHDKISFPLRKADKNYLSEWAQQSQNKFARSSENLSNHHPYAYHANQPVEVAEIFLFNDRFAQMPELQTTGSAIFTSANFGVQ